MSTILVIEDEVVTQRLLAHILRKDGYTIVAAFDGEQAFARLGDSAIDLVICDLSMPVYDGLTILRRLRAESAWAMLPVVMLTASGQDEDRIAARQAGANRFLTKPVASTELRETVAQLLAVAHKEVL